MRWLLRPWFPIANHGSLRHPARMRPSDFRGDWREDPDACAVYAESASIHRVTPRAVAIPLDAADVQVLARWATSSVTPIVARGSGSSMSGACLSESVVVDLSSLRGEPVIDPERRTARSSPGVTRGALERGARAQGLRFPVDPSSGAFCTIGGMIATNASGARTLKFGATRAWVTGLDCVFSDGSRAWVRRGLPIDLQVPMLATFAARSASMQQRARDVLMPDVRKNSSGYGIAEFGESGELIDLLAGSEGTLAIFVGVEVALCDVAKATASLLVSWTTLEGAVHGAALACEAGASACELLDRTFLRIAAAEKGLALPVDEQAEAALLIELEYTPHPSHAGALSNQEDEALLLARASSLERALLAAGASKVIVGLEPESEEALWALRHAASPILARLDPSIVSMQVIEDGVVPPVRLSEYVHGVRNALDREGFRGVIFGHAGDGNVHVNVLVDVRQDGWAKRLRRLFLDVTELTARLGGTPSGEHGDGRLRTPVLSRFWPPAAMELFAEIKSTFDPLEVLNPGVKVGRSGAHSWNAIKYDRALPPAAPRVVRVLERVSRERAYDRSRLEMLAESV